MVHLKFLKSAKDYADCPPEERPEIAVMGRSNAGKSSFLNALTGGKSVAKVSKAPGKTRLLNFFAAGEHYTLVDTPGYGYASRSGDERMSWAGMIEAYVHARQKLVGALLIMDIRREWSSDEAMIFQWLSRRHLPLAVMLNKCDKVSKGEREQRRKKIIDSVPDALVFVVSAVDGMGVEEAEEVVYKEWVKPYKAAHK